VPRPGQLQYAVAEAVRDHVFRIGAEWQTGRYIGAHLSGSPVDGKDLKIGGTDIWTYSSLHTSKALAVRCALSAPQAKAGWKEVSRWGPAGSILQLDKMQARAVRKKTVTKKGAICRKQKRLKQSSRRGSKASTKT
jgi:hypothetical protein